jgi:hypothetical protein
LAGIKEIRWIARYFKCGEGFRFRMLGYRAKYISRIVIEDENVTGAC